MDVPTQIVELLPQLLPKKRLDVLMGIYETSAATMDEPEIATAYQKLSEYYKSLGASLPKAI